VACGCRPDGPPTPFYVDLTQVFAISAAVKNGAKVHLSGWRPKTAKSSFAGTTIHSARGSVRHGITSRSASVANVDKSI
jgi:hypothetical protein